MKTKCLFAMIILFPNFSFAQVPLNPIEGRSIISTGKDHTPTHRLASDGKTILPTLDAQGGSVAPSTDSVHISIIGIGGASSVQNLNQSNAGVSFGLTIRFGNYNASTNDHYYQRNIIYTLFNPAPAKSSDSNNLAKTYLYPELSKKDFAFGYQRVFSFNDNKIDPNFTLSYFLELSTSHYDTGKNYFRSYSGMLGLKLTFQTNFSNIPIAGEVAPYYNLISLDPKYFQAINTAMGETQPDIPPTFHTLGLNFKVSVSSFQIFANWKYVLNNTNNLTNSDLKNSNFTIGVLANTSIWDFNVFSK